ncbi:MAG TPA: DUF6683 family protein [Devosiaceae bacterium]|jgi:hypothetical protein
MKKILALLVVMAAALPLSVQAQDFGWSNGFWSTTLPATTGTDTLGLALHDRLQSGAEDPVASPSFADTDLHYTPSHERRMANYANFVAKSRQANPQSADTLATVFASQDVVEAMAPFLDAVGLRIDNVADAYAAWWINAWMVSRGLDDDVSRDMAIAVRDQAADAIASSGILRGASEAAKQEMADNLLVQAALLAAAMEQSKGDPAQLRQIAAAASRGARGMDLDLAAMDLTEQGFVPSP